MKYDGNRISIGLSDKAAVQIIANRCITMINSMINFRRETGCMPMRFQTAIDSAKDYCSECGFVPNKVIEYIEDRSKAGDII